MLEEDLEVAIKVVVVGNGAVGKSSMIQRYCKGIFTKDYKKTIGVDFLEREMQYVSNRWEYYYLLIFRTEFSIFVSAGVMLFRKSLLHKCEHEASNCIL